MLTMESVRLRLEREQPMSFLEFNYSLMQAYDFVELHKRFGCKLQSSGSDQWGNVVSGIELGRRMESVQLFGLTTPLITTSSGAKMGKTAAGAVWLNQEMLSVYDYWQFWRNTEDGDVGRFLRLFTDMSLDEITRLEALQGSELNEAKKILATEATALLHGREAGDKAAETARGAFEQGSAIGLPTIELDWPMDNVSADTYNPKTAAELLKASGLASSLSDARRKIDEKAVRINDKLVEQHDLNFGRGSIDSQTGAIKVQYGKKKIVLLKPK
jgi:tyrosyl-tRNA synthetase